MVANLTHWALQAILQYPVFPNPYNDISYDKFSAAWISPLSPGFAAQYVNNQGSTVSSLMFNG